MMHKIILASGSPRRRELLTLAGIPFTVQVSEADETVEKSLSPEELVMTLAERKAAAVCSQMQTDAIVIGADTIVYAEGQVLGKPHTPQQAKEMLQMLSGKTHSVYTGVCLYSCSQKETFFEKTDVTFFPLSEKEIEDYIATGDPFDKAGGYGIQSYGITLVKGICGDYANVVGLPVASLKRHLDAFESV